MKTYTPAQVSAALQNMSGWEYDSSAIAKEFKFDNFMRGIAFVNRIAAAAETDNHHPDIDIRYSTIRVSLSTHDAGGITDKDFALARTIDGLVSA